MTFMMLMLLVLMMLALVVGVRLLDSGRGAGLLMLALLVLLMSLFRAPTVRVEYFEPVEAAPVRVTAVSDASDRSDVPDVPDVPEVPDVSEVHDSDDLIIDIDPRAGGLYIPPRPSWVESDDVRNGDRHTTAVSSGPHETERDCRRYLDRELKRAVDDYVDWYLGRVYGDRFRASTFIDYDLAYIKNDLVGPEAVHHEVIRVSFGPMHQMHALVAFGPEFRAELDGRRSELDRHWREWTVAGRLWGTALGFGVVLALLGIFCGYFHADTATRGFYTGRLQMLAAAGILTVVGAGAVLARLILAL